MSKRFGRNQKRALREEIELKDSRIEQQDLDYKMISSLHRQSKQELHDVGRILDKHFLGFDPQDIQSRAPYIRIEKVKELNLMPVGNCSMDEMLPVYINELNYITTDVKERINGMIHIRVHHPDTGTIGYAISKESMRNMPSDLFIDRISHELALQLRKEIQGV